MIPTSSTSQQTSLISTITAYLNGYNERPVDGMGFNFAVPDELNPWTSSDIYKDLSVYANPGMLRYPGGTTATYWDFYNDQLFINETLGKAQGTSVNNGWVDPDLITADFYNTLISTNTQQKNTVADLAAGYANHPFSVTFVLNMVTPGIDFYEWKLGRNIHDRPGSEDWIYMMEDRFARNLDMLKRAETAGIPIEFIELGNEMQGGRPYTILTFPECENYVYAANYFAQQLHDKDNFPNAQISANGSSLRDGLPRANRKNTWNEELVAAGLDRDNIVALVIHSYGTYSVEDFLTVSNFYGAIIEYTANVLAGINSTSVVINDNWPFWYTEFATKPDSIKDNVWGNVLISAYSHFLYLHQQNVSRILFQQFTKLTDLGEITPLGAAISFLDNAANGMDLLSVIAFDGIGNIPLSNIRLMQGYAFSDGGAPKCVIINFDAFAHDVNLERVYLSDEEPDPIALTVKSYSSYVLKLKEVPDLITTEYETEQISVKPFSINFITTNISA